ncbi:hypothetical protein LshimejAT787_0107170 [Lyophyllum shimeji]|uniref:DUF6699 domain-containing protein n=1 Tax=Lyophyllum shimeji TaxID=47721 RepID=A0A9P3UI20_LYOSH|nr:hypothetical protein LshimejAT787_0107170 [Lyophyllum shimeji]
MPGKHVRFDGIPPTPPFSYTSSLPSEDGPLTPPPLQHFGSPHAYSPLPSVPSRIHPVLGATRVPLIHYDLSLPLPSLKLHPTVPAQVLSEPATQPPLPCMTIICRHLRWSINVTASNSKHGTYVTIADVFEAIYRALRLAVTEKEFENIPTLEEKRRVDNAFRRRYKSTDDKEGYELEKRKGLKRIDFLKERHVFASLTSTPHGPEIWELNVQ